MGSCVSTNTASLPSKKSHISDSKSKRSNISKSPPPTHPILEEEAVKEVLSETPAVHKQYPVAQVSRAAERLFSKSEPPLTDFAVAGAAHDKRSPNRVVRNKPSAPFSNDDPSEICSNLSESASISTAVTENTEINGEAFPRERRQRSPARSKSRPSSGEVKRERSVGKSPGRRSEISPNRSGPGIGSRYGRKTDSGEISGRRSRSPATRMEATSAQAGLGRTQSARKTGPSPGRARQERIRKAEEGKESGGPAPASNESLENPLVSLECFIFL